MPCGQRPPTFDRGTPVNAACPSCGAELAKMPTRKTKCPSCGEFMFVKYTPHDPMKRLVTTARAEEIEREWTERGARQAIDGVAKSMGFPSGMSEDALRMGLGRCVHDERDRYRAKMAALHLARMAKEPSQARQWRQWAFVQELKALEEKGVRTVEVRSGGDCCTTCAAAAGARIPIEEAFERLVPNPSCKHWPEQSCCCAFWAADLSSSPYGFKRTIRTPEENQEELKRFRAGLRRKQR